MSSDPLSKLAWLRQILDAIPSFVFAVDENIAILEYNAMSAGLLGLGRQDILRQRSGDLLHCIHATDAPGGCGRGQFCKDCIVRAAVRQACAGRHVVRRRAKMQLESQGRTRDLYALITASPFTHEGQRLALLVIEDISEIAELQQIVPMCMSCRKVRDDDQYWKQVETYFERHWDLRFSHGLCPDCARSQRELLNQSLPPVPKEPSREG